MNPWITDRYQEDGRTFIRHKVPRPSGGWNLRIHPYGYPCDLCAQEATRRPTN